MDLPLKTKILTIAIPTWNRAVFLNELLTQVSGQIEKYQLSELIEVIVSNNDSSDQTEEIVKALQAKYSFIKYNRNTSNIGAKGNVIKSMSLSSALFTMVLGDDDRLRSDCLPELIKFLAERGNVGIVIDKSISKSRQLFKDGAISLSDLLKYFYWYIGNAGLFIVRSEFLIELLQKYDYEFFNECWPQTQTMILGMTAHPGYTIYVKDLNIHSSSVHNEVMVYSSFYLWRTCNIELLKAITKIEKLIKPEHFEASRYYLKSNLGQQVYNILQCALFIDERPIRIKTRRHIIRNLTQYTLYEKSVLFFVVIVLMLPVSFARLLANGFIYIFKGKMGLRKKSDFVQFELAKKKKLSASNSKVIRSLEFEVDN